MAAKGTLKIRVDKYLEGEVIRLGVPVRVHPVVERRLRDTRGTVRRADPSRPTLSTPVPVGPDPSAWAQLELLPGEYDLETVLPSGEIIVAEAKIVAGSETTVILEGIPSPREWLSWSHFGGSRISSWMNRSRATAREYESFPAAPTQYKVSIGDKCLLQPGPTELNLASWSSWFKFLQARSENRVQPESLRMEVTRPEENDKIDLQQYPGYSDEPMRVSLQVHEFRDTPNYVGKERRFLLVSGAAGTRVTSVPWPWRPRSGYFTGPFFELIVSESRGRLVCDATLRDEKLGGVVAYLNAGRVGFAGELLKDAYDGLYDKVENPLGAAAAGYVLLSTVDSAALERWPDWLNNLANWFPFLPDGPILRARWLLKQGNKGSIGEARDLLVRAVERGIPFFTAGVVWLLEGLRQVSAESDACRELLTVVRGVARSIDLTQGFTSFDIGHPVAEGRMAHKRP